jgi:hypothetical protein
MKILSKAVNVIRMPLSFKFYIWKERGISESVACIYMYIFCFELGYFKVPIVGMKLWSYVEAIFIWVECLEIG